MSQKLLTKELVLEKLRLLTQQDGKPPKTRALHAALGCGSTTTLLQILREIEGDQERSAAPDPEALAHFNSVWMAAKAAGRSYCAGEIIGLKDTLDYASSEAERMEGALQAAHALTAQLTAKKDELFGEIVAVQQRLTTTRAAAEEHATKTVTVIEQMSALREQHDREISTLLEEQRANQNEQRVLTARLENQVRQLEGTLGEKAVTIARLEAMLQATSAQAAQDGELRAAALTKLATIEGELTDTRLKAAAAIDRVTEVQREAMERVTALQNQHATEIARLLDRLTDTPQKGTKGIGQGS